MFRISQVNGFLAVALGLAGMVPAVAAWTGRGFLERDAMVVVFTGLVFILVGVILVWRGYRVPHKAPMPAPVRAAVAANIFFLAFCALELSDRLIRQGGRIGYWTTALFLPALIVFYGQVTARRWAWWVARIVAAVGVLWFAGFIAMVPFANLHGNTGAPPRRGRVYVAAVSLMFAGASAYSFRSLGRAESRSYFGLAREA
jgi:hypothetical protein